MGGVDIDGFDESECQPEEGEEDECRGGDDGLETVDVAGDGDWGFMGDQYTAKEVKLEEREY